VTATAAATSDPANGPNPLERLEALVGDDLKAVNRLIIERMDSPVDLIPQLAGYLIAAGGKRLRPLLTLAAARLCGYQGTRHQELAACVEFIHTATLLHDDVVDESSRRRGQATANSVWGNKASVLVGDFLFSRAFQLMVADGALSVLKILSDASAVIAEGEVLQLMATGDVATDHAAYQRVIEAKTAALFAAATEVGAVVADRPADEIAAMRRFGMELGIAFQIVDDVLDYRTPDQKKLGKRIGDDFREGKLTLPLIQAYQRASEEDQAFIRRAVEDPEQQTEADLDRAIALMTAFDTFSDSLAGARRHADAGAQALAIFPDSPIRAALTDILTFTVDRAY